MEIVVMAAVGGVVAILLLTLIGRRGTPGKWLDFDDFSEWTLRINLWKVLLGLVVVAFLFAVIVDGPRDKGFFLLPICAAVLWLFLRAWRREFVYLMGLRDDELPGRFDKLIWAVMLTILPPIGLWCFRSYHVAHWPEPKPVADRAGFAPDTV
jgi:hypothetical protein